MSGTKFGISGYKNLICLYVFITAVIASNILTMFGGLWFDTEKRGKKNIVVTDEISGAGDTNSG